MDRAHPLLGGQVPVSRFDLTRVTSLITEMEALSQELDAARHRMHALGTVSLTELDRCSALSRHIVVCCKLSVIVLERLAAAPDAWPPMVRPDRLHEGLRPA